MKTIGMLGGMSWESTAFYYRALNEGIKQTLGGLHSAKIILNSVDFDEIEKLQHEADWNATAEILKQAAKSVEAGGADFLIICTNTMHLVAPQIQSAINIPILHIADATANALVKDNINTVGLLGTAYTMEKAFYKGRLTENFGIKVLVPGEEQRAFVHKVIYEELCLGQISEKSREAYVEIIHQLHCDGAEAVILGCTEITLLVGQDDTKVPLFDTTTIHAEQAVRYALLT
ncbi:MAG: aspartate racemase [Gammaproteobacteria bacterium]|nr:aspartate racemase [Gammaproteobacteria bacterium]